MTAAQCMEKMIAFSGGNIHDIDHFIRVWTYAATIGRLEGLDPEEQLTLEIAAIVHDIACPLCREKYGRADGPHQETEGGCFCIASGAMGYGKSRLFAFPAVDAGGGKATSPQGRHEPCFWRAIWSAASFL